MADGLGVRGCVSACFKLSVKNGGMVFSDNAAVEIYESDAKFGQTFYISSRTVSSDKTVTELVCYDKMMFADKPYDYSGHVSTDSDTAVKVSVGAVLTEIGSQLGVQIGSVPFAGKQLDLSQIKDKTCRQVLELLSEQNVGYWFITENDAVEFGALGSYSMLLDVDKRSEFSGGTVKGPISRVIMTDSLDKKVYDTGGGTSITSQVVVSAEDVSQEMAAAVLARVTGKSFDGYSCQAVFGGYARVYSGYQVDDDIVVIANTVSMALTAGGIFGSFGANDVSEVEYDYGGFYSDALERRIAKNALYGMCSVDADKGFVFYDYKEATT